jgi:hypothetical protein
MAARSTVMGDQIVYAGHIEFGLGNRSEVDMVYEVFLSMPICGLEEQTETMERRAHGFRHGDLLNIGEGNKGVQMVRSETEMSQWIHGII